MVYSRQNSIGLGFLMSRSWSRRRNIMLNECIEFFLVVLVVLATTRDQQSRSRRASEKLSEGSRDLYCQSQFIKT